MDSEIMTKAIASVGSEWKNVTMVKVGNKDRPASPEDIADAKEILNQLKNRNDKDNNLITHHAISFEQIQYRPGVIVVFKIGDDDRPASPEDIEDFKKELDAAKAENRPIVTHHAVSVEYISL